jgi:mannobiose 2-epimerase
MTQKYAALLLLPTLFGLLCATRAAAQAAPPADAAAYRRLAGETEDNLQRQVLAQWFPRAVDPAGGFFQNYNEDWSRGTGNEKSIVYQARLTWIAAQAASRYPALAGTYKGYARHGLDFLTGRMWDAKSGGFFWGLDDAGAPERGGEKHVYGVSFALYALCGEYGATHDARALALAQRAYRWLDAHAHDAEHGGYYEALTARGDPILAPTNPAQPDDEIGTRYGIKTMNTHIHLLESLTALYAVWPDAGLRTRLEEVFALVRDRIAVEPVGALNYQFLPDWRPLPDHDSFGHDVETAYLLTEASAALGRPDDARTWALARRIVDHALDFGWDGTHGGFYDSGSVFGKPYATEKIWWVQAEGLNALLLMHARYGKQTPRYWAAFNRQWAFVRDHQTDHAHGGWQATTQEDGTSIPGRAKSDGWTEAYHQGRALLNVSATLRKLAGE